MAWTFPNSLKLALRGYTAAPESAAAAVRSALASGWKVKLFTDGAVPLATPPDAATRKILARIVFDALRAVKYPSPGYVANTGTVRYYDPLGGAGGGTSHTDSTNTFPSSATTVLIREGRTHTGQITISSGGTVTMFGTYDAATGARVTDLARVGTYDAAGAQFSITTQKSNTVLSGIALTNSGVYSGGNTRGFYASVTGGTNDVIVEHVRVHGLTPGSGQMNGSEAIYIRGTNPIVRHCWIDGVKCGGVYLSDNGGVGPDNAKVYDNVIELSDTIDADGPDCIQLASADAMGDCEIKDNWCVIPVNCKQVLVANGTTTGTDSLIVSGNCFFGPDISQTQLGDDPGKSILISVPNTVVEGNYIESADWGIGLSGADSRVTGNMLVVDVPGETAAVGIIALNDNIAVRYNTIALLAGTLNEGFEHYDAGHTGVTVHDNIVWRFGGTLNYGIRYNPASATEARNIVHGAGTAFVNNGFGSVSPGTGSSTADPLLDGNFRPKAGSPALTGGGAITAFVDPENVTAGGSPLRGAYQTASGSGPAQVAEGTAVGALGGSNGAITGTVDAVFSAACSPGQAAPFYGRLEKADGSTWIRGDVGLEGSGAEFILSRPVAAGETAGVVVAIGTQSGGAPTAAHVVAINCGGTAFTASNGVQYLADIHYSGGQVGTLAVDVIDTADDALYQTERFEAHSYVIPVTAGFTYEVTLQFAEVWSGISAAGQRVFDVELQPGEAEEVLIDNVDILAAAGPLRTYSITRTVEVTGTTLTIQFIAGVQNPKVSAILVRSIDGGSYVPPTTPPPSGTNMDNIIAMQKANASGVVLANAPGNNWALGGVVTKGGDLRSIAQPSFWSGNPRTDLDGFWRWFMPWYVVWDIQGHADNLNARAEFRNLQGWAYHDDTNVWELLLDVPVPIGGAYSRNLISAGTNPPSSGTDGSVRWVRINSTDSVFHGYPGVTLPAIRAERVVTIATRIEARKAPYGVGTDQTSLARYGLQVGCDTYPSSDASLATIQASYNPGSGQSRFEELTTSWKKIYWHPLNTSRAVDGSYPWSAKHVVTEQWLRDHPIPE